MMRLSACTTFIFLLFVALTTMGNRNGRAASQNSGNTGAPGDEMIAGAPRTCVNCHGGSAITAALHVALINSAGQSVTHYLPGENYTARVTITASGTNLRAYGFQMIALRDANNSDLDGFSDPSTSNNFKIATISNGRTYAEHAGPSTTGVFEVPWKAPAAGTGSVTFYASGNGVNLNNGSSGDGADDGTLNVTEATSSTRDQATDDLLKVRFAPNPLTARGVLHVEAATLEACHLTITDVQGRLIQLLNTGPGFLHRVEVDASDWVPGMYWLRVVAGEHARLVSVIKI